MSSKVGLIAGANLVFYVLLLLWAVGFVFFFVGYAALYFVLYSIAGHCMFLGFAGTR
jgi:hypothetical protein